MNLIAPSTLPAHPIVGRVIHPMGGDDTPPAFEVLDADVHAATRQGLPGLEACRKEMQRAQDAYKAGATNAVKAAVDLGRAAIHAKEMLLHGQFLPWVKANFQFSIQWVSTCRRAAEAWAIMEASEGGAAQLAQVETVEALAALLLPLQGKEPRKAKLTLDKGAPDEDEPDTEGGATDVEARSLVPDAEARLHAWAAELDAREAALAARAAELDERERVLALREAHAPAVAAVAPETVAIPVRADDAAPDLQAARDAAAKRAARKPTAAPGSVANAPGNTKGAPRAKKLPKATLAALNGEAAF